MCEVITLNQCRYRHDGVIFHLIIGNKNYKIFNYCSNMSNNKGVLFRLNENHLAGFRVSACNSLTSMEDLYAKVF